MILGTNANLLTTVQSRINTFTSFPTSFKPTFGDINCNFLALCDKSMDFTISGIKFNKKKTQSKFKKIESNEKLHLDQELFSVDRTGLAAIKVIHQKCMPLFAYESGTVIYITYILS